MKQNIKNFIQRNKWFKTIPNILTICNSLCGFVAILIIIKSYKGSYEPNTIFIISSCMIIGAMVFDALDGFAARLLNAASLKGIQMDSLADMVTFGVTPAVLVAVMVNVYMEATTWVWSAWTTWILCALYLAGSAHRLAQYNVQTMVEKKTFKGFYGLPTPAGAAAICSLVFFFCLYNINGIYFEILPYYAGLLGVLMVAPVKYQHMGKWLQHVPKSKRRIIPLSLVVIFLLIKPALTAAVIINGYVIVGLIAGLYNKLRGKSHHFLF